MEQKQIQWTNSYKILELNAGHAILILICVHTKKYENRLGLSFLTIINCSALYLTYWYIYIVCSTRTNNVFHIPYEPSGIQLYYYFLSFPLFLFLALFSTLHSYYFNLKKSLSPGIIIIWFCYFVFNSLRRFCYSLFHGRKKYFVLWEFIHFICCNMLCCLFNLLSNYAIY